VNFSTVNFKRVFGKSAYPLKAMIDPPKFPLERGTFIVFLPFLRGLGGDQNFSNTL
jgi:hypothetical protein